VPGGTIALQAFVETMMSDSALANEFRKDFDVLIFPCLNPDGVDAGFWRHNANGKDLNRDWIAFEEPETQVVRAVIQKFQKENPQKKFQYGLDFHTSYSGPYLLVLDTIPHAVKPIFTSQWIERIEHERQEELDIRPRAQTLPYCYNWMINELKMEAVTYEEGDEIDRTVVRKRAADYARLLMEILLENSNSDE